MPGVPPLDLPLISKGVQLPDVKIVHVGGLRGPGIYSANLGKISIS